MSEPATTHQLIVAIDGPAGSGKSTVARLVARALGCVFLDTGAIYRSLALCARRRGVSWDDGAALAQLARELSISFQSSNGGQRVLVADEDVSEAIRTPEISQGASAVSRHGDVRLALLDAQRRFAQSSDVVAEGRDVGTVVFPTAAVKVFLVANPEVRARRRLQDLRRAGLDVAFQQVLAQQLERDTADAQREVAPLMQADDAVVIDTSALAIEQVVDRIVALCPERSGERRLG